MPPPVEHEAPTPTEQAPKMTPPNEQAPEVPPPAEQAPKMPPPVEQAPEVPPPVEQTPAAPHCCTTCISLPPVVVEMPPLIMDAPPHAPLESTVKPGVAEATRLEQQSAATVEQTLAATDSPKPAATTTPAPSQPANKKPNIVRGQAKRSKKGELLVENMTPVTPLAKQGTCVWHAHSLICWLLSFPPPLLVLTCITFHC